MTTTKDANGKDVVNTQANLMAHAVLGAVVASAQGNSALAGASGAALGEYIAQQMYPGVPKDKLTEEQKQTISALGTLAAGLVGGIAGDSTADAVAGAQAGKNAVENNALSDIGEAVAAGKTPEQKAEEHVQAENERYKQENCAGMSSEACSVQMYKQRNEDLKNTGSLAVDFVPVIGDIKSFAEAQSALDYLVAAMGIIPGAGDAAGKVIKAAETALKKGDLAEASTLINKASDELATKAVKNTTEASTGLQTKLPPNAKLEEIDNSVGREVGDFLSGQPVIGIPENRIGHIFRNAEGHISDTPTNRQLIINVANDENAALGADRYGNNWSARLLPDGSQVWVQTRGDNVINAGVNNPPKNYNAETGLSSLKPRGSKNGK